MLQCSMAPAGASDVPCGRQKEVAGRPQTRRNQCSGKRIGVQRRVGLRGKAVLALWSALSSVACRGSKQSSRARAALAEGAQALGGRLIGLRYQSVFGGPSAARARRCLRPPGCLRDPSAASPKDRPRTGGASRQPYAGRCPARPPGRCFDSAVLGAARGAAGGEGMSRIRREGRKAATAGHFFGPAGPGVFARALAIQYYSA